MSKVKEKYQVFIDAYTANGGDEQKAYQSAYPKANPDSARVRGYKLLQKPEVQQEIVKLSKKLVTASEQLAVSELADEFKGKLLDFNRKREILREIAEGNCLIPVKKPYFNAGKKKFETVDMLEQPSHAARLKAIEIDNAMTGDVAPSKLFAAVKNVNEEGDLENATRWIVLSNGEKIAMP